ncbi:MAG: hypothetical protein HY329_08170 [Chloroflexi bacterium]|nr:hypothetical protein [Chloroflexota bacterium]
MIDVRSVTIVNPAAEDVVEPNVLAPRLASLQGARVALVDNSKRMAGEFLDELDLLLRDRYGVAGCERYRKSSPSVPLPPEVMQGLLQSCDALVHAVAD